MVHSKKKSSTFFRVRLQSKFLIFMLFMTLIPISVITMISINMISHQLQQNLDKEINKSVKLTHTFIDDSKLNLKTFVHVLTNDEDLQIDLSLGNHEDLSAWLKVKKESFSVAGIALVHPQGDVISLHGKTPILESNIKESPSLSRVLQSRRGWADLQRIDDILYIMAGAPVFNQDNQVLGYVLINQIIDQEFLEKIKKITLADSTIFLQGKLTGSSLNENDVDALMNALAPFKDDDRLNLRPYLNVTWGTYSGQFATLKDSMNQVEGLLLVSVSQEDTLIAEQIMKDKIAVAAVLIIGLGLFLTLGLGRRIIRPLKQLLAATQQIAKGDLTEIKAIKGNEKDEISELASSFYDMTTNLKRLVETEKELAAKAAAVEITKKRAEELEKEIAERQKVEEALRDSEERYALAAEGARDGLFDWNLENNQIYFSERWKTMLGYQEQDIGQHPDEWFGRIHREDKIHVMRIIDGIHQNKGSHLEFESRILNKKNQYTWVLTRGIMVKKDGRVVRVIGSQTDLTERKQFEEQLRHDAFHDKLTKLPNRALLNDRLNSFIERAKRHPNFRFAVFFIDIDRFKVINDSLGHNQGDLLLIEISKRFVKCVRSCDTVARLGGDEFLILLDDVTEQDVVVLADRILDSMSKSFHLNNQEIFVTASIGVSMNSAQHVDAEDIIREADTAMYKAKNQGRACFEIFQSGMHLQVMKVLSLEADLRRAIENKEFQLYFQPIVSLKDNQIHSMEALIRWIHPEKGLVPPLDFIPLAEETGMIVNIGEWVITEVCRQSKIWQDQGFSFNIAVNISARQFQHQGLIEHLKSSIKKYGIDAFTLEFEITESIAMDDIEFTVSVLKDLQSMGVKISIDDFGTGYSSLSSLQLFPIDHLKIDRCFVNDVVGNNENANITRAIVLMGHTLGLRTIAEGIETQEQLAFLRSLGCDYAQGYFLSRPLPQDQVADFARNWLENPLT